MAGPSAKHSFLGGGRPCPPLLPDGGRGLGGDACFVLPALLPLLLLPAGAPGESLAADGGEVRC